MHDKLLLSRRAFLKGLVTIAAAAAMPIEIIEQISRLPVPEELSVSPKYPPGYLTVNGLLIPCYNLSVSVPVRGEYSSFYSPTIDRFINVPNRSCSIEAAVLDYPAWLLSGEEFDFTIYPYSKELIFTGRGYLFWSHRDSYIPDPNGETPIFTTIGIESWNWDCIFFE